MAHFTIKNNAQAHARPKNVATAKGKIVSGAPHINKPGRTTMKAKAC